MGKHNFGIMFHHFHNKKLEGQGSLTKKKFEKIIIYLNKKYNILTPKKWLEKVKTNSLKKKDICLTFDDALLSQYTIALKILKKHNLKAFWFIYSSVFENKIEKLEIYRKFLNTSFKNFDDFYYNFSKNIAEINFSTKKFKNYKIKTQKLFPMYSLNDIKYRYLRDFFLSKKQLDKIYLKLMKIKKVKIKNLSKNLWLRNKHLKILHRNGHNIGMHAYNHPYRLASMSKKDQLRELKKNFFHIKKTIGVKPNSISYPNGSFNNSTITILKKFKVNCAFISSAKDYKNYPWNFVIKRIDQNNIL